jgi:F-type H+-transporting ATPase subunit a
MTEAFQTFISGGFTLAADNPVDHVVNHGFLTSELFGLDNLWLWSANVGNLLLSGVLTLLVLGFAASKIATGPESEGTRRYVTQNPLAHMIEVICSYLRDQTVRPLLGDRTDRFMPFLWTVFFFILINNLLGLVPLLDIAMLLVPSWRELHISPIGGTATQNLFVTAALAGIAFVVINVAGLRELGVGGYLAHLTAGTPWYLWPLMIPIEIMGTLIKPVALALRLFANMTAGHILVATLFMFAKMGMELVSGTNAGLFAIGLGGSITVVSVVAAIAIYFLELFVALLQAFVFTFLTTVFISQLAHHHDHDHDHAHDEHHNHPHGHKQAHA